MSEDEIYTFLRQIFAETFNRDDIDVHSALTASDVVGWDSFRQVEINLALEEKFNIRIRTREMQDVANVGDLVALVARKRATSR